MSVTAIDGVRVGHWTNEVALTGCTVVLFGEQNGDVITAWDWAERLDTIAYEIVCGIAINRVPRRYGP